MRAELNVALLRLRAFGRSSGPDELDHERLAHRRVQRRGDAEGGRQRVHVPELHHAGHVEQAEREGQQAHRHLHADDQPQLVVAVGQHARPHADEQDRQELQAGDDAERDPAVARELQHQPVLRDPLRPGAGEADDLAGGEQPVVADAQRAEDLRHACALKATAGGVEGAGTGRSEVRTEIASPPGTGRSPLHRRRALPRTATSCDGCHVRHTTCRNGSDYPLPEPDKRPQQGDNPLASRPTSRPR